MKIQTLLRASAVSTLALAALGLSACTTPQTRAQNNPAIMQGLSAADRELVLSHRIRTGLSKQGVYIAYGRPDRVFRVVTNKGELEAWIYTTTEYVYAGGWGAFPEPIYAPGLFYARGPRGRGYVWGGGGYWGYPGAWSPWIGVQVPHRRVMFDRDRVVAWEQARY